ncbi:hypothetical protein X772_35605 [Mesorhizobium sp. LSJC280B00]|nr:hypothetical protein X772_35605 [Mesorhizobium sp. LSJC280B00]
MASGERVPSPCGPTISRILRIVPVDQRGDGGADPDGIALGHGVDTTSKVFSRNEASFDQLCRCAEGTSACRLKLIVLP